MISRSTGPRTHGSISSRIRHYLKHRSKNGRSPAVKLHFCMNLHILFAMETGSGSALLIRRKGIVTRSMCWPAPNIIIMAFIFQIGVERIRCLFLLLSCCSTDDGLMITRISPKDHIRCLPARKHTDPVLLSAVVATSRTGNLQLFACEDTPMGSSNVITWVLQFY